MFPASLLSSPHVNKIRPESTIHFTKLRSAKSGVENALMPYVDKKHCMQCSNKLQPSFNTRSCSDLANANAEPNVRCRMSLYTGHKSFIPQVRNNTGYCGCFRCNLYQKHEASHRIDSLMSTSLTRYTYRDQTMPLQWALI